MTPFFRSIVSILQLLFIFLLAEKFYQVCGDEETISCNLKSTCTDCITSPSLCAWCKDEDFKFNRCNTDYNLEDVCSAIAYSIYPFSLSNEFTETVPCECLPKNVSNCKKPGTTEICSEHGACLGCGECICLETDDQKKYYGSYCECDDSSCPKYDGKICSGNDHGVCMCGYCNCYGHWTGSACECSTSTDNCFASGSTEICSGNGECNCGACSCFESEDGIYHGRFCEQCPTCNKCEEFRACVQCLVFNSGELTEEQCNSDCTMFVPILVDKAEVETSTEKLCNFKDNDGFPFAFVYGFDENDELHVRVQSMNG